MNLTKRSLFTGLLAAGVAGELGSPAIAQQRVEIQFWHAMGGVLGERVGEIVKRFNDSQTKYTVVATNKGNYDEVINATVAAYRAKKAPQIAQIYERGFMAMLLSGAIVPVQELMTEKKKQVDFSDFIKPVASYYQYKGKLMSMPFNSSTPILFYNKEQFEKAGFAAPADTWGEFEKQLYAIKSKGAAECGSSLAGDYFWSLLENYSTVNDQPWGTKSNGYDGLDTEFVYNKTRVVQQAARLQKWVNDGIMQIAGQGLSPEQLFTSGKCATYFASTAAHGGIERDPKIKWSATYLPHEADLTARNSSIGGATLWVMKGHKPEEYDGVADFLEFLAKPDLQVWWHKATGYVPISRTAYQMAKSEGYYKDHPTREIAILQLNRGTPTPNSQGFHFGNYTQATFALREEMESVFANKKTPQQGLDDAVRRGNELLRQFEKLNAGKY
ncbi:extracellular solute-binding protein [Reyranella sp.]|jgi:sn-glycerol 3-phosphate transport system substrate-binding protein|uniref:extracellular solute-binding protein n=1 Tax=Reyranella sp. TaxID=1929291 RepID=UPI002F929906